MSRGSTPEKIQEWTDRFFRFQDSQATVAQFCRLEGISPPSFYLWKRRLKEQLPWTGRPMRRSNGHAAKRDSREQRPRAAFEMIQIVPRDVATPGLTVHMSGGVRVDVRDDLATIQAVIRELVTATQRSSGDAAC